MPSLSSLLQQIPDEFKPLASLGVGSVILVVMVVFHGTCLHRILLHFKRREMRLASGRPHLWIAAFLFGWAIFLMLTLHIVEIFAWGASLLWLGLAVKPADAMYFCANAYTTMGFGTVDLAPAWRNITPVIAISGLFTFAWTTSLLVTMVGSYIKIVEQLEVERMKQLDLRAGARHAEWEAITKERQAERALRDDTRQRAGGVGFFARRKMWEAEKQEEAKLRDAARTEVDNIRQQEQREENKLGQVAQPDDPEAKK